MLVHIFRDILSATCFYIPHSTAISAIVLLKQICLARAGIQQTYTHTQAGWVLVKTHPISTTAFCTVLPACILNTNHTSTSFYFRLAKEISPCYHLW